MKWISVVGLIALGSMSTFAAESIEREATTTASPSVSIEVDNGALRVVSWDKKLVRLTGEIDDRVEDWSFEGGGDTVDIIIEEEENGDGWSNGKRKSRSETELVLQIPQGANLSFEGISTSIEVAALKGTFEAETVNGSINASELYAPADVATVNGELVLTDIRDELEVNTVNGDVLIRDASGETIQATAVNGDMEIESIATHLELEAVNGDINAMLNRVERLNVSLVSGELEATLHLLEGGRLTADTVSGDLEIALVDPINIRVDAESMSGDLDNHITKDQSEKARFFGKQLNFTTGDSSARIEVNTVSGDLLLSRANN